MEVYCTDTIAEEKCNDSIKKAKVVSLTQSHLGLASVVTVSSISEKECLELSTASGVIQADYKLNLVV